MATGAERLLIFGASARAAAFSALRAGLVPWCADLFADADLRARCPAMRLPGRYPQGFFDLIDWPPPGPWMYTGGLENWPTLLFRMARRRPLWGNNEDEVMEARSPLRVARAVRAAGLPVPEVQLGIRGETRPGRWLVKPLRGAGGEGIRLWGENVVFPDGRRSVYLQRFIPGDPASAVYVGDGQAARLLGLTRQLVGEPWLRAGPFRYCGSVGPLEPAEPLASALGRLGDALASRCRLRGLFGVDGVLRDGAFWPVEVNPRYTASVEVLEYATGLKALAWHALAFEVGAPAGWFPSAQRASHVVGKGVLFARAGLTFPGDGPWRSVLDAPAPVEEMPAFADVPDAGARVEARRPVLTVFARAATPAACEDRLRRRAAEVERWLYPEGGPAPDQRITT